MTKHLSQEELNAVMATALSGDELVQFLGEVSPDMIEEARRVPHQIENG